MAGNSSPPYGVLVVVNPNRSLPAAPFPTRFFRLEYPRTINSKQQRKLMELWKYRQKYPKKPLKSEGDITHIYSPRERLGKLRKGA